MADPESKDRWKDTQYDGRWQADAPHDGRRHMDYPHDDRQHMDGLNDGMRYPGTVTHWMDRGYGFIQLEDGRRAYVHASAFGGGELLIGESVTAKIVEDAQNPGKWQAKDLRRDADEGEEGVVTSWKPNGYGFLTMDDNRRVYIHHHVFGGGDLQVGQRLRVVVKADTRSPDKWCVAEVKKMSNHMPSPMPMGPGPMGPGPMGPGPGSGPRPMVQPMQMQMAPAAAQPHSRSGPPPMMQPPMTPMPMQMAAAMPMHMPMQMPMAMPMQMQMGMAMMQPMQPQQPVEEMTVAEVMEWDPRGFGFAQTEDGRRVYVHHSAFGSGDLRTGERLSVVITPDQRNPGKLMASRVERDEGHAAEHQFAAQMPMQMAPAQMPMQMQMRPVPQFVQAAPRPLMQAVPSRPMMPIQPIQPIQPVSRPVDATPGGPNDDWVIGTVTEWHEDRGYGFIELIDGRRLYVHHSAFGGGSMIQGVQCEAVALPDKVNRGKWCASFVRGDAVVHRTSGDEHTPPSKRQRIE